MKCEACGGDGLIEVGAYRGDDSPDTRECRLCGGPKPVVNIPAGTPIDRTVEILKQLGQTATKAGVTLKESTSGSRRTVAVVETRTPHEHSWKERLFADLVEYACECSAVAIFSRRDGSLLNPADISEFDKLYLSSRTMTRSPLYEKTAAKEHADERLEQLRLENERRQYGAEQEELRRRKIETELKLLEAQRGTYIAKGMEPIMDKYEQYLRQENERLRAEASTQQTYGNGHLCNYRKIGTIGNRTRMICDCGNNDLR